MEGGEGGREERRQREQERKQRKRLRTRELPHTNGTKEVSPERTETPGTHTRCASQDASGLTHQPSPRQQSPHTSGSRAAAMRQGSRRRRG